MNEGNPKKTNLENKEKKVLWAGTIGFDFIFTYDIDISEDGKIDLVKKPICVELNGSNSAISGIQEIQKEKYDKTRRILAKLRGSYNPELARKQELVRQARSRLEIQGKLLSKKMLDHLGLDFSTPEIKKKVKKYIEESIKDDHLFLLANENPEFVTEVCLHKKLQDKYIPEENRPARWQRGVNEDTRSGFWILKPDEGAQGINMHILQKKVFDKIMNATDYPNLKRQKNVLKYFVVEEFLKPLGAQEADDEHKNNPASLRLLLDFRVLQGGEIAIDSEFSYQRVSKFLRREGDKKMEDVFIVNRARGAKAFNASKEELDKCRPICLEIIKRLNQQMESKKLKTKN